MVAAVAVPEELEALLKRKKKRKPRHLPVAVVCSEMMEMVVITRRELYTVPVNTCPFLFIKTFMIIFQLHLSNSEIDLFTSCLEI